MTMNTGTKKYLYILIVFQIVICLVTSVFVTVLIENISNYMQTVLEQEALSITENKMRERVENMVSYIEHEREFVLSSIKSQGEFIIRMAAQTARQERTALHDWVLLLDTMDSGQVFQLALYDSIRQEKTEFIKNEDKVEEKRTPIPLDEWHRYVAACPYHLIAPYGQHTLYILAPQENIDKIAKGFIYRLIHASVYGSDGYVWVNEILDYDGGDDYALRLIHPNLPETEGQLLSTNSEDATGRLPYLTELEGIRNHGEIFHTYHFQELHSDKVSEKASYAKLYEPFNWIIATGEPLSSVFSYVHGNAVDLQLYNKQLGRSTLLFIIGLLIVLSAADIGLIVIINRRQSHKISEYVKKETRQDALTGADTRRFGEEMLIDLFHRFQQGAESPLVMMLDLDDFKNINDTHGHDMGDEVLCRTTQAILSHIRSADRLFRWGGEEFVILFNDHAKEHDQILGEKILECVSALHFKSEASHFRTSISIGSSWFHADDTTWRQVLKRADKALYHSKESGKNRYTSYDKDMMSAAEPASES